MNLHDYEIREYRLDCFIFSCFDSLRINTLNSMHCDYEESHSLNCQ